VEEVYEECRWTGGRSLDYGVMGWWLEVPLLKSHELMLT